MPRGCAAREIGARVRRGVSGMEGARRRVERPHGGAKGSGAWEMKKGRGGRKMGKGGRGRGKGGRKMGMGGTKMGMGRLRGSKERGTEGKEEG